MKEEGVPVDTIQVSSAQNPSQQAADIRSYLNGHPEADAIFTLGPPDALSVNKVLEEEGLFDRVKHSTVVLDKSIVEPYRDGEIVGVVEPQPYFQGFMSVVGLYLKNRHGFEFAHDVFTDILIDPSDLARLSKQLDQGIR